MIQQQQQKQKRSCNRWKGVVITLVVSIIVGLLLLCDSVSASRSLASLLQDERDGTLLSKSALIEKAHELRLIVQNAKQQQQQQANNNNRNRKLNLVSDYAMDVDANGTATTDPGTTTNMDVDIELDGAYTEERVLEVCQLIQNSFVSKDNPNVTDPVLCNCMGTLHGTFTISCDYNASVCTSTDATAAEAAATTTTNATSNATAAATTNATATTTTSTTSVMARSGSVTTCGKPQLGVTMVRGSVFSATTCISEYKRGLVEVADTCVFVNSCPDSNEYDMKFCECTASHAGRICQTCQLCEGGKSISVDCTNINPEAISTTCAELDLDFDLSSGSGALAGFVPKFDGFCTQLEELLDNQVTCDCTNAVDDTTGSFEIKCTSIDTKCDESNINCGTVASSIQIVQGQPQSIQSCASYQEPFGETCTTLEYCPPPSTTTSGDNATTTAAAVTNTTRSKKICGCTAFHNGNPCNSCAVCNDGDGIQLDCSNVYEFAIIDECQIITPASSYEFLPKFKVVGNNGNILNNATTSGGEEGTTTTNNTNDAETATIDEGTTNTNPDTETNQDTAMTNSNADNTNKETDDTNSDTGNKDPTATTTTTTTSANKDTNKVGSSGGSTNTKSMMVDVMIGTVGVVMAFLF